MPPTCGRSSGQSLNLTDTTTFGQVRRRTAWGSVLQAYVQLRLRSRVSRQPSVEMQDRGGLCRRDAASAVQTSG